MAHATPQQIRHQFLKLVYLYTKSPSLTLECAEIYEAKKLPETQDKLQLR